MVSQHFVDSILSNQYGDIYPVSKLRRISTSFWLWLQSNTKCRGTPLITLKK